MLGYAKCSEDLALGRTIDELATGDLARYDAVADVFEIVGRSSRFVKPFGVRVDLDALETWLRNRLGDTVDVAVGGSDERLTIIATGADPASVAAMVRDHTRLPAGAMIVEDGPVPRTMSGKVEYGALRRDGSETMTGTIPGTIPGTSRDGATASVVFASIFELDAVPPAATFVSLGGDSLSYIECSIRLEDTLGRLPSDWHLMPVAALDRLTQRRADAVGPGRHDRGAPSTCDLCGRGDPHAAPLPAGRRAHAVGGRGVQSRSVHDADRVDPRSCACRVAHGRTCGRADDGVGGMLLLGLRGDVRHRHGAAREQLRRPTKPPRRCLAFLVHRGLRPTDPRRHRLAGGAIHPPPGAAVPVRIPAGTLRLHPVVAHGVGVDGRLVQHPLPNAHHRVLLRTGLADSALRLDAARGCSPASCAWCRSPTSSTTPRGSG